MRAASNQVAVRCRWAAARMMGLDPMSIDCIHLADGDESVSAARIALARSPGRFQFHGAQV
jgi:hypothetical protein